MNKIIIAIFASLMCACTSTLPPAPTDLVSLHENNLHQALNRAIVNQDNEEARETSIHECEVCLDDMEHHIVLACVCEFVIDKKIKYILFKN